jgi:hypothetical protein
MTMSDIIQFVARWTLIAAVTATFCLMRKI